MVTRKITTTNFAQIALGSILLTSALGIFFPDTILFKWGKNYAVHIMFGYLSLGLFFLLLRQQKLMFTSFACCAALCLYLKSSSSTDIIHPVATNAPSVNIAQITISASNDEVETTIESLLASDADILSIHEVTPDWGDVLEGALPKSYPFYSTVYRPDDFQGIAIYSKYPIQQLDTFYYNSIPNLSVTIEGEGEEEAFHFVSSYIYPEFGRNDAAQIEGHFDAISHYISKLKGPVIAFGDYNQVQWSDVVQNFKADNLLYDSRRFPFFDYPSDHIFYSSHFKCTDFQTIQTPSTQHLGVVGNYQLDEDNLYAQKAAQKF